jgi:rfaE bifunctional protein kinase chain/domain
VPIPVAFVGSNSDGKTLKKILAKNDITTDFLVELTDYRTPKKSRILSGGENTKKQQVLRIDALDRTGITKTAYQKIEDTLRNLLAETDYLIISDYLYKSVIPDVFNKINEQCPGRQMIIDSRDHLMEFKNASIATPNEPEIKKLFPVKNFFTEREFYEAGEELRKRLNAAGIILKRGHKGMIVFEKDKAPEKINIHGPAEIVDVTGAGDTVISVISLALSAGADFLSAARLANVAAGIVVMKEGCYPIAIHELENELK